MRGERPTAARPRTRETITGGCCTWGGALTLSSTRRLVRVRAPVAPPAASVAAADADASGRGRAGERPRAAPPDAARAFTGAGCPCLRRLRLPFVTRAHRPRHDRPPLAPAKGRGRGPGRAGHGRREG